ncbi:hypothetical protein [Dactylosporangium sp. NPDC050588]|uniref:hypothetical protein n=1 Tax=Dactylosporangium sp. NPDC050588 TaxID=3157211 RepID=UPI0033C4A0B6
MINALRGVGAVGAVCWAPRGWGPEAGARGSGGWRGQGGDRRPALVWGGAGRGGGSGSSCMGVVIRRRLVGLRRKKVIRGFFGGIVGFGLLGEGAAAMVVRLVRAGVGALLLLIAVPLGLAGGGLWVAMEHRAGDDTFTARLERLRSGGRAVVVPDVDALLRADAPFARGGQTTLSLSAVGSSGPLFIGLAPEAAVGRYLDGKVQARIDRVRLARGPLPVEFTEVETRAAAANAAKPGTAGSQAGQAQGGASDPATTEPAVPGAATPAATVPGAEEPSAGETATAAPGDVEPGVTGPAVAGPGVTAPGTAGSEVPGATAADPNVNDPNSVTSGGAAGNPNVGSGAPGEQTFWLAKSVTAGGAAELTWSPSALRGRHLALVVMNADGTAGIDATVTARLTPAWIGPTAGGLLMLGAAGFLLALLVLAWPPRRAEGRLVLPTLPSQPTKSRAGLRRNLSTLSEPIAALLNPVVPKNRDMPETGEASEPGETPEADKATEPEADKATEPEADKATEPEAGKATEPEAGKATAAEKSGDIPVIAVAVASQTDEADRQTTVIGVVVTDKPVDDPASQATEPEGEARQEAAAGGDDAPDAPVAVQETPRTTRRTAAEESLAETELDRPAPAEALDDDAPGPLALPPLPKLPPIELQFTWAPVAVEGQEEAATSR